MALVAASETLAALMVAFGACVMLVPDSARLFGTVIVLAIVMLPVLATGKFLAKILPSTTSPEPAKLAVLARIVPPL